MNGRGIRILSVADDDGIRFSRELVLRQEGYEVESVVSNARFDSPWVRTFPIAVLCHSVNSSRAAEVAEALRQRNPSIAVVRVHAIRSSQDFYYDVDCEALPGPDQLLQALENLVTRINFGRETQARKRA
jgi:DNA-binding NtrC family response regulator